MEIEMDYYECECDFCIECYTNMKKETVENWFDELYEKDWRDYWMITEEYKDFKDANDLEHTDDLFFEFKKMKLISRLCNYDEYF